MAEQEPQPSSSNQPQGMAIASMVLGIVSVVLLCVPYIGIPAAIVGLILGIMARKKVAAGQAAGKGMATTGMILSIIALALIIILLIVGASLLAVLGGCAAPEMLEEMEWQMEENMDDAAEPAAMKLFSDQIQTCWIAARVLN